MGGFLLTCYLIQDVVPNSKFKDWAKDEAEERLKRRESGLPVKFGYNYAALRAAGQEPEDKDDE